MKSCPQCSRTYSDEIAFCPHDAAGLTAIETATEAQLAAAFSRRFRIVRRLGEGGMGTVYLAEQIAVGNRPVALKVLIRRLLDDSQFLMRFQDEAASTGRIRHANVVTIYESGQADDGTPYIAMEYLEGESLRDAIKRRGALPLAECAEILQQTARGLNAAHKLGIIHRDLKPDNIFLTRGDEGELIVKVVDFGIAKLRESAKRTMTGMVLGTPAYMSHEQASGMRSDQLDLRSDVYSLGIVVYEMLTGRVPFHSDTPLGYLRKHMMEEPPAFRSIAQDLAIPPQIEAVVLKALAKDRDERFPSALDFAREFSRAATATAPTEALSQTVRVAGVQAEQERLDREKAEAERPEKESAEAASLAPEKAERERLARERVEAVKHEKQWARPATRLNRGVLALVGACALVGGVWYLARRRIQPWLERRRIAEIEQRRSEQIQAERKATIERSGPAAEAARLNPKDGLKYVWIPPGTFTMGCSPGDSECRKGEKPAHQVTITNGFWIGQTEVTVAAYKRFTATTNQTMAEFPPGLDPGWMHDNMPIVGVKWEEARDYCAWVGGRLPTEAEWEYAARSGSTEARYGKLDEVAWYDKDSGDHTHEVAQKRANGFGLYDMLGNADEWVLDGYDESYYQGSALRDPQAPERVFRGGLRRYTLHVVRGGGWSGPSWMARVSSRDSGVAGVLDNMYFNGFRCAGNVFGR